MCCRFHLKPNDARKAAQKLGAQGAAPDSERHNIAPGTSILAMRGAVADQARALVLLRWGLIPAWSRTQAQAAGLTNARGETAPEKPSFKDAFAKRRCVIPASGFFEWTPAAGGGRQPWYFEPTQEFPLLIAGLWEPGPETEATGCLVTTEANTLMRPIHDRMPVLLTPDECAQWLEGSPADARQLLRPSPEGWLRCRPVDPWMNQSRNEGPRCTAPYTPGRAQAEQLGLEW